MNPSFIHLRTHSAYSLAEGALPIKKLIQRAVEQQMPAVALTDSGNLFGALEFSIAACEAGIQPIIGCQLNMISSIQDNKHDQKVDQLIVLAQNEIGYQNLVKIVSHGYLKGLQDEKPTLSLDFLEGLTDGLICLTGGHLGGLNRCIERGINPQPYLTTLQKLFPDRLYIELSRQGKRGAEQERIEEELIKAAYQYNTPLVATNEVFFPTPELYEAHDVLLCIADGTYISVEDRRRVTADHYFKSSQEIEQLFADLPEAIANTHVIARRCSFLLEPIDPILPSYPCAAGRTEAEEMKEKAVLGLEERLRTHVYRPDMDEMVKQQVRKLYFDRLEYELAMIERMNFPGYFLVVADFIQWAKSQNIPVGPGRGSGAGSVVAWALTITDIDPIRFGLLFERFLNPERVSLPDFDIDFCQERRDEVIRYVQDKYGADRVAHIITFGKLQARAVLRDVGRVLQMPYSQVDKISKLVPNIPTHPLTLKEAIDQEPQLQEMRDKDPEVKRLMEIAMQLEGLYRHASTHAAGVVIGNKPLIEMVPLYYDPRSPLPATQFNMKYVEQAGLLKFDFLGLKTLTVIQQTLDFLKQKGIQLDISTIPLDDEKAFALLQRVETVGVFQVEGSGFTDVVRKLKPNRFEEIIALIALYRPGPMDNIPRYIACRNGEEPISYDYPQLESILGETYGVIVYQEQVLQIARDLAGYTLGGADLLRRAMGKKIKSEMDAQRKRFIEGTVANIGGNPAKAEALFDQIDKFANYAFNKAHATAYAIIVYQTAYLKAHYPAEFMASLMTLDMHNTDKLASLAREVKRMGIPLLPPDANKSNAGFGLEALPEGRQGIRYALAALKNVGEGAMKLLSEERQKNGSYRDIFDFVERLDSRVINKRQLEHLIAAGALDCLSPNRRQLLENLEVLLRYGNKDKNQMESLFHITETRPKLKIVEEVPILEKLNHEFMAVGFYLTSHPLDIYGKALSALGILPYNEMVERVREGRNDPSTKLACVVLSRQERSSKNGQRYAFIQCSDSTGIFEVVVFSELLIQNRDLLEPGKAMILIVNAQGEQDNLRLSCLQIQDLENIIITNTNSLTLQIQTEDQIKTIIKAFENSESGSTAIFFKVETPKGIAKIKLADRYTINSEMRSSLASIPNIQIEEGW